MRRHGSTVLLLSKQLVRLPPLRTGHADLLTTCQQTTFQSRTRTRHPPWRRPQARPKMGEWFCMCVCACVRVCVLRAVCASRGAWRCGSVCQCVCCVWCVLVFLCVLVCVCARVSCSFTLFQPRWLRVLCAAIVLHRWMCVLEVLFGRSEDSCCGPRKLCALLANM